MKTMKLVKWVGGAAGAWLVVGCSSDPGGSAPAPATTDGGASDGAPSSPGAGGGSCTAARDQLLKPVDSVSSATVRLLGETGGVKRYYVDASAGGPQAGASNPRLYFKLATGERAVETDKSAPSSTEWDLAIKRPILFTNSGDGGKGKGGAVRVDKDFAVVSASDAAGASFATETFLDPTSCAPNVDPTGAVKTTFDGWYDYEQSTNTLSPRAGTWLVKAADGATYKLRILSYYATDDGGVGQAGGHFVLEVAAL